MRGSRSVQTAPIKVWLDCLWISDERAGNVDSYLLASRHSCMSSEERKFETMTPPSRAMISLILPMGSEASMVTRLF